LRLPVVAAGRLDVGGSELNQLGRP